MTEIELPTPEALTTETPTVTRWSFPWKAWLAMLATGLVVTALVPPFQSPDEPDHIERAQLLAQGVIVLQTPAGHSSGGYIDSGLAAYLESYRAVGRKAQVVTMNVKDQAESVRWSGVQVFRTAPGTGYYFPLIYLPQAVGLTAGRLLDRSVDTSYRIARLLTLLSVITLLAWSSKYARPGPLSVGLLMLPTSIFQMSCASIDGLSFALTVFILSVTLRTVHTRKISPALLSVWSLALFTLLSSRIQMLPLLLVMPYIAFLTRSRQVTLAFAVTLTACAAWVLGAVRLTRDLRVTMTAPPSEMALKYLTHPGDLLRIFNATFHDTSLTAFYQHSFLGILGWGDGHFGAGVYSTLGSLLVTIGVLSVTRTRSRARTGLSVLLIGCALASAFLIFFMLLITWTTPSMTTVAGVQGRYFIPAALAIAAALHDTQPDAPRVTFHGMTLYARLSLILLAVLGLLIAYDLPQLLAERYYLT